MPLMKHDDHKSKKNVAVDLCSVTHNTNSSLIFHVSWFLTQRKQTGKIAAFHANKGAKRSGNSDVAVS